MMMAILTPFGTRKRIFLTRGSKKWVLDLRDPKMERFKLESDDVLVVDRKKTFDAQ